MTQLPLVILWKDDIYGFLAELQERKYLVSKETVSITRVDTIAILRTDMSRKRYNTLAKVVYEYNVMEK